MELHTTVTVPDLVGLPVEQARVVGHDGGVVVSSADPDGPPLGTLTWPGAWVVTAQHPPAGTVVERRSYVVIDFRRDDGGDAGDRAALPPSPDPRVMRAARRPEDAEDSAGW